jgi:cbb3-type cytochrome oxidase subunit 3
VEDVGYLEIGPIVEDQVASDDYVDVVRGRRGKHDFELARTGLHSAAQAGRKSAADDELTLQAGRQTIAFRQSRRKVVVVSAVPAADVAIAVGVTLVAVSLIVTVAMAVIAVVTVVAAIVIVIAIVFVVAVAIALRDGDRGRKCQTEQRRGAGPEA